MGKWLKLHSLYNLDRNGELFNELCSHTDYKPQPIIIINNVIKTVKVEKLEKEEEIVITIFL